MAPILLFSDVDGTLLDREGRYAVAPGELASVADHLLVVLASSRTILELAHNQHDLGLSGPVVAENGAVVAFPWDARWPNAGASMQVDDAVWSVIPLGAAADGVRHDVRRAAQALGVRFEDQHDVEPAVARHHSVLIRPFDGDAWESLAALAERLRDGGYVVSSGGAWLAVTGGAEKGDGARAVRSQLAQRGVRWSSVAAVGDDDNDHSLLLAADQRFVMRRDDGRWHPALAAIPGAHCVSTPGIAGWREVLHHLTALQEA